MGETMCAKQVNKKKNRNKKRKNQAKRDQRPAANTVKNDQWSVVELGGTDKAEKSEEAKAEETTKEPQTEETTEDTETIKEMETPIDEPEEASEKAAKEAIDIETEESSEAIAEELQVEEEAQTEDDEAMEDVGPAEGVESTESSDKIAEKPEAVEKELKTSKKRQHKLFPALWWVLGVLAVILVGVGVAVALGVFDGDAEMADNDSDVNIEVSEDTEPETPSEEEKPDKEEAEKPAEEEKPVEPPKPAEDPVQPIAPRPENEAHPEVVPGSKLIALTFDDGPSAATTPRLLDTLQSKGVKATFFVLGTMAQRAPDVLKREQAEGHEVASHTPYHNQLTTLTAAQVRAEALEMDRIFTEILGTVPPFTRPPYGSFNATVGEALGQPMVLWSIDPRDWQDRNASIVCSRVVSAARDGAIILVHDIHATTVDAVPCIIDSLRAQGYEFLTISELAAAKDVPLVNGQAYYSF